MTPDLLAPLLQAYRDSDEGGQIVRADFPNLCALLDALPAVRLALQQAAEERGPSEAVTTEPSMQPSKPAVQDDPVQADERRLEFRGDTIGTQRLHIVTAHLSDLCGDFVCVYHRHGDDSETNMLFTNDEARYLHDVLGDIIQRWKRP